MIAFRSLFLILLIILLASRYAFTIFSVISLPFPCAGLHKSGAARAMFLTHPPFSPPLSLPKRCNGDLVKDAFSSLFLVSQDHEMRDRFWDKVKRNFSLSLSLSSLSSLGLHEQIIERLITR